MTAPVKVLLVDDHDLLRGGLAAILQSAPQITVVGEAASGPAAVTAAVATSPDVVLMDVEMPEGDGITATRHILQRCPHTRVLVLTTFDLDEYVYEALRAGASGFLLKTTAPDELVQAVQACAAGTTLLSPGVTRRLIESYVQRTPNSTPGGVPKQLRGLTLRELDVLRALARGRSNAEIARDLYLGEATVKTHVARVLAKLELRDRIQAVVVAYECGLVLPSPPP